MTNSFLLYENSFLVLFCVYLVLKKLNTKDSKDITKVFTKVLFLDHLLSSKHKSKT